MKRRLAVASVLAGTTALYALVRLTREQPAHVNDVLLPGLFVLCVFVSGIFLGSHILYLINIKSKLLSVLGYMVLAFSLTAAVMAIILFGYLLSDPLIYRDSFIYIVLLPMLLLAVIVFSMIVIYPSVWLIPLAATVLLYLLHGATRTVERPHINRM